MGGGLWAGSLSHKGWQCTAGLFFFIKMKKSFKKITRQKALARASVECPDGHSEAELPAHEGCLPTPGQLHPPPAAVCPPAGGTGHGHTGGPMHVFAVNVHAALGVPRCPSCRDLNASVTLNSATGRDFYT